MDRRHGVDSRDDGHLTERQRVSVQNSRRRRFITSRYRRETHRAHVFFKSLRFFSLRPPPLRFHKTLKDVFIGFFILLLTFSSRSEKDTNLDDRISWE